MRSRAVVVASALVVVAGLASAATACSSGGSGIGVAPPHSAPCPQEKDAVDGKPCGPEGGSAAVATPPQICCYPLDAGTCTTVAVCSGRPGGTWHVETRDDGGVLPDSGTDTGTDTFDGGDGGDGGDGVADSPVGDVPDSGDAGGG